MKEITRWKSEPWHRKEPGQRLTPKARALQVKSQRERTQMEKASTQDVYVIFPKYLVNLNMRHKFTVEMNVPLREEEILERMQKAFPNLKLKSRRRG